jgi:hypothetical protein
MWPMNPFVCMYMCIYAYIVSRKCFVLVTGEDWHVLVSHDYLCECMHIYANAVNKGMAHVTVSSVHSMYVCLFAGTVLLLQVSRGEGTWRKPWQSCRKKCRV